MKAAGTPPLVSVVLPVFNGERHVAAAVQSVLAQTLRDFELIVIDDGSDDRTPGILAGIDDPRLRIVRHAGNLGLVASLNEGIGIARGTFIARMDSDDLCHANRFERQVAFLARRADVEICGSWFRTFGKRTSCIRPPLEPGQVRARLFFGWAAAHPALMMRRAFVERNELRYDPAFGNCEDYDFLCRAARRGRIANVPEYLLSYRLHDSQTSVLHAQDMAEKSHRVRIRQLAELIGGVSRDQEALHRAAYDGISRKEELPGLERWLLHLDWINRRKAAFEPETFRAGLAECWQRIHGVKPFAGGMQILRSYWGSSLRTVAWPSWRAHARLAAKCLLPAQASAWLKST